MTDPSRFDFVTSRPNILFFLSDQHSSGFVGTSGCTDAQGRPLADTPNLDKLCAEGTSFSNAYCQNPLCVPSRSSLLTGRYSKHLGIYENRHILEQGAQTIPGIFAQAGYRTALVGKAHFNGEQWHGYQQRPYGDILGQAHQSEYIRTGLPPESEHGLEDLLENSGPTDIPLPLTQTEICVSEAVKWLQCQGTDQSKPFFLSVNFDKPHFPYRPPKQYFEKYLTRARLPDSWQRSLGTANGTPVPEGSDRSGIITRSEHDATTASTLDSRVFPWMVPFVRKAFEINGGWEHYGTDRHIHERALAAYCGCVEWVDDAVGRIIAALEYLGLSENTIVVYASDHGEMAGAMGAWQKTVFYDRSSKVPLAIRWPGHIKQDMQSNALVELLDLMPTFCDLAGIPVPPASEGCSLADHLCTGAPVERDAVFSESAVLKVPEHAGCMMRTQRYKYNYYLQGSHELYDMQSDPDELVNLIDDPALAETAAQMRSRIEQFWEPEKQIQRYMECARVAREKHFHLRSNQFVLSEGTLVDAKP